jgi:hypothetical protein
MSGIRLEWHRDAKGYRIKAAEPPGPLHSGTITESSGEPERIVRVGGEEVRCEPMKNDRLFVAFAHLKTSADVLSFIKQSGPLTTAGLRTELGESVDRVLEHASHMKHLLVGSQRSNRHWTYTNPTGLLGNVKVSLVLDDSLKRSRLQYDAPDLLTALWLQFGQAITKGTKSPACRHCGVLFEVGPGTGRRGDSQFCSNLHKREYFSLQRSAKRAGDA